VVTPRDQVRQRIAERNRYNPVSDELAHRASAPGWEGRFKPKHKEPGDVVITSIGAVHGKLTGTSGS